MSAPVVAQGVCKRFGDLVAVDSLDLEIEPGECFGMLGPNGAGKSSTMRMIGCVSPITSGRLDVLGCDVRTRGREIKARIGVVPQEDNLDGELRVEENLLVYAGYFGLRRRAARGRTQELLEFMGLEDRAADLVRTLSGGMKRRLVIARALVNEPELILLDEPTTGLDPQARHHIWERLRHLRSSGATLLLTTHYMEEATHLCDRLVIMDRARVRILGTPRDLIRGQVPRHVVEVTRGGIDGDPVARLTHMLGPHATDLESFGDRIQIHTDDSRAVLDRLATAGVDDAAVFERMATLEDVFLRLVSPPEGT